MFLTRNRTYLVTLSQQAEARPEKTDLWDLWDSGLAGFGFFGNSCKGSTVEALLMPSFGTYARMAGGFRVVGYRRWLALSGVHIRKFLVFFKAACLSKCKTKTKE